MLPRFQTVLIGCVLSSGVLCFGSQAIAQGIDTTQSSAQTNASASNETTEPGETTLRFDEYEEKLNAILKTRRDEEKKFVAEVVDRIENGTLPEKLVETSFKWVMNERPDTNYPFVYFERVLRIQANKLELEVPNFDYNIYRIRLSRNQSGRQTGRRR